MAYRSAHRAQTLAGMIPDLPPDRRDVAVRAALLTATEIPLATDHAYTGIPLATDHAYTGTPLATDHAYTGTPLATDRAYALVTLAEGLPAEEHGPAPAQAFIAIRKDRVEGRWLGQLIELLPAD